MGEWYFAYGSNLWVDQMVRRTGPLRQGKHGPRRAFLPEHRLIFNVPGDNGQVFANVITPGAGVQGVLYCCSSDALSRLDASEPGYERRRVIVTLENGEQKEAFIYVADVPGEPQGGAPMAEYLNRIITGAKQHGLPDNYVSEIEALVVN